LRVASLRSYRSVLVCCNLPIDFRRNLAPAFEYNRRTSDIGSAGGDNGNGPVTPHKNAGAVYFSGDTVRFDGVAEVLKRFPVCAAILNLGAARVPAVGRLLWTMMASGARVCPCAAIVPPHFGDWAHLSEGREQMAQAFADARWHDRLNWLSAGRAVSIEL
jgi:L-ascorbate metabolism protein UlaG (beta-lactamase superfamily)